MSGEPVPSASAASSASSPPVSSQPQPSTSSAGSASGSGKGGRGYYGRYERLRNSRAFGYAGFAWRYKGAIGFSLAATYYALNYYQARRRALRRDAVHPGTYLYWKLYDGGIVECQSPTSTLSLLLSGGGGSGTDEEPPRIMTLWEVTRALEIIKEDDNIEGIFADFSSTSVPQVPAYSLGLAQIEEIQKKIRELKEAKRQRLGPEGFRTVAYTDTFDSQASYLLATSFDEIYMQPTGEVPLVGLSSTLTFYRKLLNWLGVKVHAEARNEYKSYVSTFTQDQLTEPQSANQMELMNDLNDHLLKNIAIGRFPELTPEEGLQKMKDLILKGPFSASESAKEGLINGAKYKRHVLDDIKRLDNSDDFTLLTQGEEAKMADKDREGQRDGEKAQGGGQVEEGALAKAEKVAKALVDGDQEPEERKLMGFYHYYKVLDRTLKKKLKKNFHDIGVVYVLGTIGDAGEFSTAKIVQGLKEAGNDDTIGTVILRVDSGGGGVLESDTIWDAVQGLREKNKLVIASFGNAAASGGYLISTHTDAIVAGESTITGSIGVAGLRPTITQTFFDKVKITVQSFFTGSKSLSLVHELEGDDLKRHSAHVDEMYEDFKNRVVTGRDISPELIDDLAGGRVYTGKKAFDFGAQFLFPSEEDAATLEGGDSIASSPTTQGGAVDTGTIDGEEQALFHSESLEGKTKEQQRDLQDYSPVKATPEAVQAVHISEDQETSPYAPPEPESASPTPSSSSSTKEEIEVPEQPPSVLVEAEADLDASYPSPSSAVGRGLVDIIGGLRDAAMCGLQLYLLKGLQEGKENDPERNEAEILQEIMPNCDIGIAEDGTLLLPVDLRLKKFPVDKSFWQAYKEAVQRGDAIDSASISLLAQHVRVAVGSWLFRAAIRMMSSELDDLGVGAGLRSTMGVGLMGSGFARRRNWLRAEMPDGLSGIR